MKENSLHYNYAQLRSMLVGAPDEYLIAGRGTGKTEGVLAPKTVDCYLNTMPRGCGVIVGRTFTQILTRTLPGLIYGWEKLGYKRDVHFIVGTKPNDKWVRRWRWDGPFRPPLKFEYFISWWNGAGIHLVSQDRTGSSNGITIDWIAGDEAKLLDHRKLVTELFPANRGLIKAFENNPYHHGKTFTTDMPTGTGGRWLLDIEKEMDKGTLRQILTVQQLIYKLQNPAAKGDRHQQYTRAKQIEVLQKELNLLRRNFLYYHEASTLDNIHALGMDYIRQQLRDSSIFDFNTQILNIKPSRVEDGFYPDFDEENHGYFAYDYGFIDQVGYNFNLNEHNDSRKDADVNPQLPFHISLDYNRRIFPLVAAQLYPDEIRVVNGMHVLYPNKLKDVIDSFCNYYRFHKRKVVYYWYDHTAVGELEHTALCNDVVKHFYSNGWTVIRRYIGMKSNHEETYRMFGHLLRNTGKYKYTLKVNRDNCRYLIISINNSPTEQRENGFGKDKKSERDPKFPAEESTHYGEALDVLCQGILDSGLKVSNEGETFNSIIVM